MEAQVERFLAVASDIHGVGLFAQALGDETRHSRLVLRQQESHGFPAGR